MSTRRENFANCLPNRELIFGLAPPIYYMIRQEEPGMASIWMRGIEPPNGVK